MERLIAIIFFAVLSRGFCGDFSTVSLTEAERTLLYQQAKLTPGARQVGLGCAFYANVPLLTIASGVNIADGSNASREFASQIYGLRKGDFRFSSAFDREMFFKLFHIPSKGVKVYYREATRGELLADAEETVLRDLAPALDRGCFVSLRVLGEFGGPHNVLLMAHRSGKFFYHEPRTGRIVGATSAELASRILTVSKARSKVRKRYFSSYHLIALPAPANVSADFRTPADFPKELGISLTPQRKSLIASKLARVGDADGVTSLFPGIDFVTKGDGDKSLIGKDLDTAGLYGVYGISKLALHSHHSGKRGSLPVWLMDGAPLALVGYSEGDGIRLTFFDGESTRTMTLAEALAHFKKSGRYLGYITVP